MGVGGWMVKWKLNRKKRKTWIPTGGGDPLTPSRSATGEDAPSDWH